MNTIIRDTIITYALNKSLNESAKDKAVKNYLKKQGIDDIEEIKKIRGNFLHDIPNLRLDNEKFMLGCIRMHYNGELNDVLTINNINNALKMIHNGGHTAEYDFDLNGLHATELSDTFREIQKVMGNNDRKRSENSKITGKTEYTIIPIESFKEAKLYGKYTSWCVTHQKNAFNSYTINGARFYFCLHKNFKNIQRNDDNAPLNEWGLSMIAVNVDKNGDLTRITTRYNHEYNGENNPELETTEQLEKVLNVKFYDTFKPYTREDLRKKGIIFFDDVQDLLDNGEEPCKIFDGIFQAGENFNRVFLNNKQNFIDSNNKLLSSQWFTRTSDFDSGIAKVYNDNHAINYINTKGQFLFDVWLDNIYRKTQSANGFEFYVVEHNRKFNYVDEQFNLLSDIWYDDICCNNGLLELNIVLVQLEGKFNFLDLTTGKYLLDKWPDYIGNVAPCCNYIIQVRIDDKGWNYFDIRRRKYISDRWFTYVSLFNDEIGFGRAYLNDTEYKIDKNGKIVQ